MKKVAYLCITNNSEETISMKFNEDKVEISTSPDGIELNVAEIKEMLSFFEAHKPQIRLKGFSKK
jgi:hypothetical protein